MTGNVATKAEVYGEQGIGYDSKRDSKYEKFTTWAKYTGSSSDNPQTFGAEYFSADGVECVHGGSGANDYWAPNPTYYWPKAGYLSFHAFSPSNLSPFSGTLTHDWSNGFTITNFQAGPWHDNYRNLMVDILYSDYALKKQRSDYSPVSGVPYDEASEETGYNHKGVNLTFHHALAGVQFYFKTDANYSSGRVKYTFETKTIELLHLNNKGEFHENRTAAADNSYRDAPSGSITFNDDNSTTATPYWIPSESEEFAKAIKVSGQKTTVTQNAQKIGSMMLIMPQNLAHSTGNKVTLKLTYKFTYQVEGEGAKTYDNLIFQVPLNGGTGTIGGTNCTIDQWLINHKYTYTIVFHLDPLLFDPYISVDWVDVSPMDINLPHVN